MIAHFNERPKIRNTMNIGCNEPITGGEREHFDGKKGSRLVFSASPCSSLPNCPKCGHNRKVFKAGKEYVCSEFHKMNADVEPPSERNADD
jgi:hypothetical protein